MIQLTPAERKKLLPLLEDVTQIVEGILLTGLTTISNSTLEKLNVVLQEVSRLRLLRFSSSLRIIIEELKRFQKQSPMFSKKRLSFFINRSWLLSHGVSRAIQNGEEEELRRLLWSPETKSVKKIEVVTLGVGKKVVPHTFCAFEFRLRNTKKLAGWPAASSMLWSCVFPLKSKTTVMPEAFLSLPQRQKFKPKQFLENCSLQITNALISKDQNGVGRISLTEKSKVEPGKVFSGWSNFLHWDLEKAVARIQKHQCSPLELEIEMQEEVVLENWTVTEQGERDDQYTFSIEDEMGISFEAVVSKNTDGNLLLQEMKKLKKKKQKPPLFGLVHYERCRLVLQPLSLLDKKVMRYINISNKSYDTASLLKTLNF